MHQHWASEPDHDLTEADLRLLYEQAHDPEPELAEHVRLARHDGNSDGIAGAPAKTTTGADAGRSS